LEKEYSLDQLQTLIKELETEKAGLLRLIGEAVKEQEFLSAHFHTEALGQIDRQLQTLKNLDDELYDKKYCLEMGIENSRKRLIEETDDKFKSIMNRFIEEKEKELYELNQTPKRQRDINGKRHLPDYLEQFIKGKVKGLRISLSKSGNLSIEIRNSKYGNRLIMHNIKKLEAEYLLTEERLLKMKGLGFSLNNKRDKATAILNVDRKVATEKIMRLLSIIVFEVFYFKELDNETIIEIINKKN
jgi:hypothetical protein